MFIEHLLYLVLGVEGTEKGWVESGLRAWAGSLSDAPPEGSGGEPGTGHVLGKDELWLSHCPVARGVPVAGVHGCLPHQLGVVLASPLGFPTRSLTFWSDAVVLQVGRIMLVSGPSSKSPAWDVAAQRG